MSHPTMIFTIVGWLLFIATAIALIYVISRARNGEKTRGATPLKKKKHADETGNDLLTYRPAIIAHEIRTPLALIRGAGELLEEGLAGDLTEQQRHFVRTMTTNTQQVIDLTESIITDLKLSRGETLSTELVDVRDIVTSTAREMRRITSTPIHVNAVGGVLNIHANATMLRQVMWNLINNSLRHGDGTSPITISVASTEDGGAQITVEDSGPGITPETQEKMFDAFTSDTTSGQGSGIGLMVSQRIIEAHGGRIMVDSLPECGTVIHVVLPKGK